MSLGTENKLLQLRLRASVISWRGLNFGLVYSCKLTNHMRKLTFVFCVLALILTACVSEKTSEDMIVSQPDAGSEVGCPLHVEGSARGFWFFEGSFPVSLLDRDGNLIAQAIAQATDNWMTEDYVPFVADIYYQTSLADAILVLQKDNPSGLPEFDASVEVPVRLGGCDQTAVESYIRENIATLSPTEPVLGGSWYVVSVDFFEDGSVEVVYEDGHIQESFVAKYEIAVDGEITLKQILLLSL